MKAAVWALPAGLQLYVTGHSLGGALAVLATLDIAVNTAFHSPIMYTLAGPRVSDPDFANRFDAVVVTNNTSSCRASSTWPILCRSCRRNTSSIL